MLRLPIDSTEITSTAEKRAETRPENRQNEAGEPTEREGNTARTLRTYYCGWVRARFAYSAANSCSNARAALGARSTSERRVGGVSMLPPMPANDAVLVMGRAAAS